MPIIRTLMLEWNPEDPHGHYCRKYNANHLDYVMCPVDGDVAEIDGEDGFTSRVDTCSLHDDCKCPEHRWFFEIDCAECVLRRPIACACAASRRVDGHAGSVLSRQVHVTSHHGAVLDIFTAVERVMSDVYDDVRKARVWNGEEVKTVWYVLPTSRADATQDVLDAVAVWQAEQDRQEEERLAALRRAEEEREAREPRKGRRVRVVRGRKVPIGTEGECFWRGASAYGERVGLKDASGTVHWTAVGNVQAVE